MMHMWMWFGFDLGEFMFPGLTVSSRWSFALTWIALFFVALLYEGSKVYLARTQRAAVRRLYPFRSDERRNLLCDREQGSMEPTTSRNGAAGQPSAWLSFRIRALVNAHQSAVFVAHSAVGYLLMLAVMLYNVHLLLAVVFGTMLGYFLFGSKLTRLQMQCFGTKRIVICTPECDDTAETTPPRGESPSSEPGLFCQTRTCIQPSHYFRAGSEGRAACQYGADRCLSKVARRPRRSPDSVEDAQLLTSSCCDTKPPPADCCSTDQEQITVEMHQPSTCCKKQDETQAEA